MKVTGIEIDSRAETVPVMGEPRAFMGGMIDLHPERAGFLVIGHRMHVVVHLDEIRGDEHNTLHTMQTIDGHRRGTVSLDIESFGEESPGVAGLLERARLYEREGLAPEGLADELMVWLREKGVEA